MYYVVFIHKSRFQMFRSGCYPAPCQLSLQVFLGYRGAQLEVAKPCTYLEDAEGNEDLLWKARNLRWPVPVMQLLRLCRKGVVSLKVCLSCGTQEEDCYCLLKPTGFHSLSSKDGLYGHINCRTKKRGSADCIFNFL